ncbi:MAG: hypothetical protein ABGY41_11915, partial [Candidatus Poribacteria bacterium]
DPAFHTVGPEGLTVEGWFYLDSLPDVGQVQTFFTNWRKYTVGVGTARSAPDDEWYDPTEARAFGSMWWEGATGTGRTFTSVMGYGDDRVPPVGEWFHVALQFHAQPPFIASRYLNKVATNMEPGLRGPDIPVVMDTGNGPLYIATAQPNYGSRVGFRVVAHTEISNFRGLVDDFRVSSVVRYEGSDAVRPRHFVPDADTLALWTFDGAQPLADVSGNDRDLIQDGDISIESLAVVAVEPAGKLATTWAKIRSRAR